MEGMMLGCICFFSNALRSLQKQQHVNRWHAQMGGFIAFFFQVKIPVMIRWTQTPHSYGADHSSGCIYYQALC